MTGLSFLAGIAPDALAASSLHSSRVGARVSDFDGLKRHARSLAQAAYAAPPYTGSSVLRELSPEEFTEIRFLPEKALWRRELDYEIHFIKPGVYADRLVALNEIRDGAVHPIPYDPEQFDLGRLSDDIYGTVGGHGGFKAVYPLHPAHHWKDELIVFHGASYFRFLGQHQQYGLSARGIAVDTGLPRMEEFPDFREFWLQKPSAEGEPLVVLALLDGPSIAGAYRFEVSPGEETGVSVEAVLYPRKAMEKLGLAPLTSMYITGDTERQRADGKPPPKVHDSDGLQILTQDGRQIWRPLVRRRGVQLTEHHVANPRGFGLMQRDLSADNYDTPEKRYHKRPGYWVTPRKGFDEGHVELMEIGSTDVDFDSIGAFFVPAGPIRPGEPIEIAYDLRSVLGGAATSDAEMIVQGGWMVPLDKGRDTPYLRARVTFAPTSGPSPADARRSPDALDLRFETRFGRVQKPTITQTASGAVDVDFFFEASEPDRAEVMVTLLRDALPVSETWSYLWTA